MFGLEILDIGIGLIFIYLVLSLMCSAAGELAAGLTNSRAKTLKRGIERLFEDTGFADGFAKRFFEHSLIRSLVESPGGGPSYIPSRTFSTTVLDLLATGSPEQRRTWDGVRAGVDRILESRPASGTSGERRDRFEQTVRVLVDRAHGDIEKLESEIGAWFDSAMERVSAWYKRRTQWVVLLIGLIVAGASNADTIGIVESLSRDSALRSALVAQAEASAQAAEAPEAIKEDIDEIEALGIPLGWSRAGLPEGAAWIQKVVGLVLTAFALSLGAPFWFDLLKKAVNIRSVGQTPQEAEDRRKPPA